MFCEYQRDESRDQLIIYHLGWTSKRCNPVLMNGIAAEIKSLIKHKCKEMDWRFWIWLFSPTMFIRRCDPALYRRSKGVVMLVKTFKYRLYPSKPQARLLEQTVETCRRWYNLCLEERKTAWENEQRSISKYDQLAKVKMYRKENPFASQLHSHILQVVTADIDKAFQAFFRRVKAGEKAGYPRFKGNNRFDSFGLKEYGNGFKLDGRRLRLTGIGRVRVRWHRPLEGTIKTVRICRQAGEWYACFACEVQEKPLEPTGREVGIDVGLYHLLATSENEVVDNPRWYREEQKNLRVIQRQVSRRKPGGANRRKSVLALQRFHAHIANSRKDYLDKLVYRFISLYIHLRPYCARRFADQWDGSQSSSLEKHPGRRLGLLEKAPDRQSGRSWSSGLSCQPDLYIQDVLFVWYGVSRSLTERSLDRMSVWFVHGSRCQRST